MKAPLWMLVTLLFLAACNSAPPAPQPAPVETPLVLDSFAATPNPLPQNQGTVFNWTLLGGSGEITCELDVNSDGTVDYTLGECTSATKQPHLYQAPGTYSAKLKVTDQSGVSQEKSTTVTVLPVNKGPQIMRFEAEKGKTDLTARILFTVFDKEGDIVTCRLDTTNDGEWDYEFTPCRPNAFSKGVTITPSNTGGVVEVTYPAKGSYTAKLEAFDAYGEDRAVLPLELPYITLPPPGACEVTNLSNSAVGSLRYWVESGRCRVVTFYPGLEGSIWLKNTDIDITQDITIIGPGPNQISVYGEDDVRHFRIFDGDVAISGLTLREGRSSRGGSVRTEGDSLTLSNMVFKNNRSDGNGVGFGGGAIMHQTGTLSISHSRFESNFSDRHGGAIYSIVALDTTTISNSVFSNNQANLEGGAIYSFLGGDVLLRNTDFINNEAFYSAPFFIPGGGGAITKVTGFIEVNGGVFANNFSNYQGGAIYQTGVGNDLQMSGASFINNFAFEDGGAIYKLGGNDVTISGGTFRNNQTGDDGGAIRHSGDDLNITNATFEGNQADDGGAIFNDGDDGNISDSTFGNNSAADDGGAIYNSADDLTINGSTFSNNSASDDAGGIYNDDDDLTINSSTFSNNSAGDDGGAIRNISDGNNNILTVNDSIFSGNQANDHGGAIHTEDPLTITGTVTAGVYTSRFFNNRADADGSSAGNGGAIYRNDTSATFSISGTSLISNTAYNGGAIYRDGGNTLNLNFTGNVVNLISGNTAANRGGGVFNNDNDANFLTVPPATSPLIVTNNTCNGAAPCGGGVYRTGGTIAGDAASAISGNVGSDVSP